MPRKKKEGKRCFICGRLIKYEHESLYVGLGKWRHRSHRVTTIMRGAKNGTMGTSGARDK